MRHSQDALYAEIDLDLSWSERDLPQRPRDEARAQPAPGTSASTCGSWSRSSCAATRPAGGRVLDLFAGVGDDVVQALESERRARRASISPPSTACARPVSRRQPPVCPSSMSCATVPARFERVTGKPGRTTPTSSCSCPALAGRAPASGALIVEYESAVMCFASCSRVLLARPVLTTTSTSTSRGSADADPPRARASSLVLPGRPCWAASVRRAPAPYVNALIVRSLRAAEERPR